MTVLTHIQQHNIDRFVGLIAELGEPIVEAEIADFCWEAREREAWIGAYEVSDEEEEPLDRIAILSRIGRQFHTGVALVDGDGAIHDLVHHHRFTSLWDADEAFLKLQSRA